MEITDSVKALTGEYLEKNGIELVEIEYKRREGGMTLRILADTAGGITVDECEALNNFISEELDRHNIIEDHYLLEVSSPGLDRPIKTDRDFERAMGKALEVSTYQHVDGKKHHAGILMGINREEVVLEADGISVVIPRTAIAMARLKIEV
jgi:ribosome maturation factor RimP